MRNGVFSNAEPRSSTKSVCVGAGRASFERIQPASTDAVVGSGGAAHGAAAHVAASSARPSVALVLRSCLRLVIDGGSGGRLPEIVEIEPVVRGAARVVFQARGVTAGH